MSNIGLFAQKLKVLNTGPLHFKGLAPLAIRGCVVISESPIEVSLTSHTGKDDGRHYFMVGFHFQYD